ncbi:MAG: biopolymer transporter ExbD [Candidatus Hydrogenedentota bacterium]
MRFKWQKTKLLGINITPLIDVIFQLLIFFAVATTFDKFSGMKLELPGSHQKADKDANNINISVDKNGNIYFETNLVNLDELGDMIKEIVNVKREIPLVLRADRSIPHGLVVEIMDIAKQSGIRRISIATKTIEE